MEYQQDIINNRGQELETFLRQMATSAEIARFAIGYLFLPGLARLADHLQHLKELRLLIGNTTNRETLEQLAEAYRHIDLAAGEADALAYPKRTKARQMMVATGENLRSVLELMDQTNEHQTSVNVLMEMVALKRLKVRVYTRGRLQSKAYIFNYKKDPDSHKGRTAQLENGIAVVGSSNISLSGIRDASHLNVAVRGNNNHAMLVHWFDELWEGALDFNEIFGQELKRSWALASPTPHDIYMKTLYTLVRDRVEGEDDREILWDDDITDKLADFQKVAVRQAIQIMRDYGGVFVADVVGLGKSYIGAAIVKHFERIEHVRPLIVCPASLVDMWDRYNEVYDLNARVLSMGLLRENNDDFGNVLFEDTRFRDRDLVLIDESHNLRHPDTQRYRLMQAFLATGKRCCFLTATPRNKSCWDVYHQIKLFHQDDRTDLPIDPPNLRDYFKLVDAEGRKLPGILAHILIRRTRNHILRWYGFDAETEQPLSSLQFQEYLEGRRRAYVLVGGRQQFFPKRVLETVEYSIEDTYQGLYQQLRGYLGKAQKGQPTKPIENELTYARYGIWHYVLKDKQREKPYVDLHRSGTNLRGLMRILLFKRFESSVYAFKQTVRRLLTVHQRFLEALGQGIVPAGDESQALLYEPNQAEEQDLMDALRRVSGRYDIADFAAERLKSHIGHDIRLLESILDLVEPITPDRDAKLQTLSNLLEGEILGNGKQLIFTQYADTAQYLFEYLNPGGLLDDIDVICGGDKNKARTVARFAPNANPEYRFGAKVPELTTLIATDVLAEGLNLQDCDKIVNYDLHWNPVRLIQRFGRIDRIGSEHDVIYGFNFLPEAGLEQNLGLHQKLRNRIQEIHDTIGEDTAILDPSEQVNEDAMYAIYENKGLDLALLDDPKDEFLNLNEAEELLRQLRKENPSEYWRIAELSDGIRTGKASWTKGLYVFCQAGRYQQLALLNEHGKVLSKDIPQILAVLKCERETPIEPLPRNYNSQLMHVKQSFVEEVKQRQAEREYTLSLTQAQRYTLRELRILFSATEDETERARLGTLEQAFRGPITTAINRELNRIRRNGLTGRDLLRSLGEIYHQHNMQSLQGHSKRRHAELLMPKIICSEALV